MEVMKKWFTFLVLSSGGLLIAYKEQASSSPYISGNSFRACADFVIDFKAYGASQYDVVDKVGASFAPSAVKKGDTIFVNTDLLAYFFSAIHPAINNPYILITHNSDAEIPGLYRAYLDDPKIIAWFGQNRTEDHAKLYGIPIGLANNNWPHGNTDLVRKAQALRGTIRKDKLVYLNIRTWTNARVRSEVEQIFAQQPFCSIASNRSFSDYLSDLTSSIFVLSPRGNGLDCHRTWEAMLMGSFPIVQSSAMDGVFDNLPVVIVHSWHEITKEFLENKYKEMIQRTYNLRALYLDYWLEKIREIQIRYR